MTMRHTPVPFRSAWKNIQEMRLNEVARRRACDAFHASYDERCLNSCTTEWPTTRTSSASIGGPRLPDGDYSREVSCTSSRQKTIRGEEL